MRLKWILVRVAKIFYDDEGSRTLTASLPTGFESVASAIPPHRLFKKNMELPGLEPGITACKAAVLPLHHSPMYTLWDSNPEPSGYKPDTLTIAPSVYMPITPDVMDSEQSSE